jgi:hypothetical protein
MTYTGPTGTSSHGSWPVTPDTPRLPAAAPRPDPIAAILMLIGGAAGVVQLFVPWLGIGGGLDGTYTGWDLFRSGRDQALSFAGTVSVWSVPVAAIAGGALVLLGLALFTPINHRPLGAAALVFSLVGIGCAIWWVVQTRSARGGFAQIFEVAQVGWYLFLAAGLVGLIASIKALATG